MSRLGQCAQPCDKRAYPPRKKDRKTEVLVVVRRKEGKTGDRSLYWIQNLVGLHRTSPGQPMLKKNTISPRWQASKIGEVGETLGGVVQMGT